MELETTYSGIEKKFYEISSKVVTEEGYQLYDMEYVAGQSTLRLFIMDEKTGSAVIEDCVKVDRAMTPYVDVDWVPSNFVLEVSSPGMFRELKRREHFENATGEFVKCTLSQSLSEEALKHLPKSFNGKKAVRGKLEEVLEDKIIINLANKNVPVYFAEMKKASLDPEF